MTPDFGAHRKAMQAEGAYQKVMQAEIEKMEHYDHSSAWKLLHESGYEGQRIQIPIREELHTPEGLPPSDWISWQEHLFNVNEWKMSEKEGAGEEDARIVRDCDSEYAHDGYLFKVWLQHEYERMVQGLRSVRILGGQSLREEELETSAKIQELVDDMSQELQRIIDTEPEEVDQQYCDGGLAHLRALQQFDIMFRGGYDSDNRIDPVKAICESAVRILLGNSKEKNWADNEKGKWERVYKRQNKTPLQDWASKKGVLVLPEDTRKEIIEKLIDDPLTEGNIAPMDEWLDGYHNARSMPALIFVTKLRDEIERVVTSRIVEARRYLLGLFGEGRNWDELGRQINPMINDEIRDMGGGGFGEDLVTHLLDNVSTCCGQFLGENWKLMEQAIRDSEVDSGHSPSSMPDYENTLEIFIHTCQEVINEGFGGDYSGNINEGQGIKDLRKIILNTYHNTLRLADNILIMLEVDMGWVIHDGGDFIDVTEHYTYGESEDEGVVEKWRGTYPNMLRFTRNFTNLFRVDEGQHAVFRTLRNDQRRWMYCLPESHVHTEERAVEKKGGYLDRSERLSILSNIKYEQLRKLWKEDGFPHRTRLSSDVIKALNHLQQTQWETNLDFLQAIAIATGREGVGELCMPIREHDVKWKSIDFKIWVKKTRGYEEDGRKMDKTTRAKWDNWGHTLGNARKSVRNGHNVFWHPWACDWRGRFYPRTTGMSPVGDDFDRALIRFKHWKPLGDSGIKWFHIHVCNLFSGVKWGQWESGVSANNKLPFDERCSWTIDNLLLLRIIATKFSSNSSDMCPDKEYLRILGLDKLPRSGSEAFQRLAVILELNRVHAKYEKVGNDWNKVTSGQPVYLDASNNGFQHAAALLRSPKLALAVNVLSPENEEGLQQDLYEDVANEAREKFDYEEEKTSFREKLEESPQFFKNIAEWGDVFERKMVKSPTMIATYGAKDLLKCYIGRDGEGKPGFREMKLVGLDSSSEYDEFPKKCIRSRRGAYGTKDQDRCPATFTNMKEYLDHMNKKHKWVIKLHEESPLKKFVNNNADRLLVMPIEELSADCEDALVDIGRSLCSDVRNAIDVMTGDAYNKIGVQGLVPIQNRCYARDPKNGGVVWNSDSPFGVSITNIDVDLDTKTRVAPWRYWKIPSEAEKEGKPRQLWVDVDKFLKNEESARGELPKWVGNEEIQKPDSTDVEGNEYRDFAKRTFRELLKNEESTDEGALDGHTHSRIREIRHFLRRLSRRHSLELKWPKGYKSVGEGSKAKRGVTPNFVHSLDAAHMRRVICSLADADINDLWVVHDCFGTHACDIETLRGAVKDEFVNLHEKKGFDDRLIEIEPDFDIYQDLMTKRPVCSINLSPRTINNEGVTSVKILFLAVHWGNNTDNRMLVFRTLNKELRGSLQHKWEAISAGLKDDERETRALHWIDYLQLRAEINVILRLRQDLRAKRTKKWLKKSQEGTENAGKVTKAKKLFDGGGWEKALNILLEVETIKNLITAYELFTRYRKGLDKEGNRIVMSFDEMIQMYQPASILDLKPPSQRNIGVLEEHDDATTIDMLDFNDVGKTVFLIS